MVAIQGLKMNFRNKTIKSNAHKMIKVLEEKMQTEAAMNKNPVNDRGTLHQIESQIDEVNLILKTWNTITHSNQIENSLINYARMFKKALLPFELISGSGRNETEIFKNDDKKTR